MRLLEITLRPPVPRGRGPGELQSARLLLKPPGAWDRSKHAGSIWAPKRRIREAGRRALQSAKTGERFESRRPQGFEAAEKTRARPRRSGVLEGERGREREREGERERERERERESGACSAGNLCAVSPAPQDNAPRPVPLAAITERENKVGPFFFSFPNLGVRDSRPRAGPARGFASFCGVLLFFLRTFLLIFTEFSSSFLRIRGHGPDPRAVSFFFLRNFQFFCLSWFSFSFSHRYAELVRDVEARGEVVLVVVDGLFSLYE